jgi:two-component system KDP operon response regulator KdpE
MNSATILVVDDEPQLRRVMLATLTDLGYVVVDAKSGEEALEKFRHESPDLVLLDLNMPGIGGLETCRAIRSGSDVPIIILSVRNAERDKVEALDAGADDYVTKPFGVGELLARVRAALRHGVRAQSGAKPLQFEAATVDLEKRRAVRDGEEIRLTPIEFRLLACLAKHLGMVVTHRQLLAEVWGPTHVDDTHYLRIYMKQLRDKLEIDPVQPRHLRTETGLGYRLVVEEEQA